MSRYTGHWQAVDARGEQHEGEVSVEASGMVLAILTATAHVAADRLKLQTDGDLIELTITLAREGA